MGSCEKKTRGLKIRGRIEIIKDIIVKLAWIREILHLLSVTHVKNHLLELMWKNLEDLNFKTDRKFEHRRLDIEIIFL